MKKYPILAVLLLFIMPGCFNKKAVKSVEHQVEQSEPAQELVKGYTVSGDADEFVLEEDIDQDIFDDSAESGANVAAAEVSGNNSDFDTDDIAYDNQSLDPIQFDFDSGKIRPTEVNKISNNARILKNELDADANLRVIVKGHACKIAKCELHNRAVSQKRAYNVANEYIKQGVPKKSISTIGFGASQLLTNEDGMEAQSINRRAETELVTDNPEQNVRPSAA